MRADQPTRFTETNALLAVTEKDYVEAREILADYSPTELRSLEDAAEALSQLCYTMRVEKLQEET